MCSRSHEVAWGRLQPVECVQAPPDEFAIIELRQMVDWFSGAEPILQAKACPTELLLNKALRYIQATVPPLNYGKDF